jgi:hypothetical protein
MWRHNELGVGFGFMGMPNSGNATCKDSEFRVLLKTSCNDERQMLKKKNAILFQDGVLY